MVMVLRPSGPVLLLLLLLSNLLSVVVAAEKTWSLLHSFDGQTFTPRGQIKLALSESEATPEISLESEETVLDSASIESMVSYGLYQVKILDESTGNYVMASVPACQVKRAYFRDELEVLFNAQAAPISLTYTPLVSKLAPSCEEVELSSDVKFQSKITYDTATPAMTIPIVLPQTKPQIGLTFFPRSQGAQAVPGATQDGQPEATTPLSFLSKYWYIALPLFIMGIIGPAEDPPPGEQQRGGGGGSGGQAAAPAGAARGGGGGGGSSSGGGPRRRGKRG